MTVIARSVVTWNGLTALPGVSVFYFDQASTTATAAIKALFDDRHYSFPSALSFVIPGSGDLINDTDGSLAGTWTNPGSGTSTGAGGSVAFAAGVGIRVRWLTGAVIGRRRLVGSTFFAPIVASQFDSDGTPAAATVTDFEAAASTLAATGVMKIWHRPHKGMSDGSSATVTGSMVPDRVTSLRTRRY